jgi:hypothetical protein
MALFDAGRRPSNPLPITQVLLSKNGMAYIVRTTNLCAGKFHFILKI